MAFFGGFSHGVPNVLMGKATSSGLRRTDPRLGGSRMKKSEKHIVVILGTRWGPRRQLNCQTSGFTVDITIVHGAYNGFINQLISGGPHPAVDLFIFMDQSFGGYLQQYFT